MCGTKRASPPTSGASRARSPPVTKTCGGSGSVCGHSLHELADRANRAQKRPLRIAASVFLPTTAGGSSCGASSASGNRSAAAEQGLGLHPKAGQDHAPFERAVAADQVHRDRGPGIDDDRGPARLANGIGRNGRRQSIDADSLGKIDPHGQRQVAMGQHAKIVLRPVRLRSTRVSTRCPSRCTLATRQRTGAAGKLSSRSSGGVRPVGKSRVADGWGSGCCETLRASRDRTSPAWSSCCRYRLRSACRTSYASLVGRICSRPSVRADCNPSSQRGRDHLHQVDSAPAP